MRNIIGIAIVASLGLATAASAQTAYDDGQVVTGRSVGTSVQFDGYRADFGSGGRPSYTGSQTRSGGPSGAPNQNGG